MLRTIVIRRMPIILVLQLGVLMSCSAKQGYTTLQDWQSYRCKTLIDSDERERCLEETQRTYDEYINSDEYKENNSGRRQLNRFSSGANSHVVV